jgi:hypothetical protein
LGVKHWISAFSVEKTLFKDEKFQKLPGQDMLFYGFSWGTSPRDLLEQDRRKKTYPWRFRCLPKIQDRPIQAEIGESFTNNCSAESQHRTRF